MLIFYFYPEASIVSFYCDMHSFKSGGKELSRERSQGLRFLWPKVGLLGHAACIIRKYHSFNRLNCMTKTWLAARVTCKQGFFTLYRLRCCLHRHLYSRSFHKECNLVPKCPPIDYTALHVAPLDCSTVMCQRAHA